MEALLLLVPLQAAITTATPLILMLVAVIIILIYMKLFSRDSSCSRDQGGRSGSFSRRESANMHPPRFLGSAAVVFDVVYVVRIIVTDAAVRAEDCV